MSLRPLAVCAIVICAAGCYKQEQVNSVRHDAAWQRQAGQSTVAAAQVAQQSEKNSQELVAAMQSGKTESLENLQGKLVKVDAEITDQNSSAWTMKKEGWTIIAAVNDQTPHSDVDKSQIVKCSAQGIIQAIDTQNKKIVLADVELAPEMKNQFAENVAAK
jgi:hypothetical protein